MIEVPRRAFDAQVMLQGIRIVRMLGRAISRQPMLVSFEVELTRRLGLFDRGWYLGQVDADALRGLSPLRHYVLHGDRQGLSPTPMFDLAHYDRQFRQRFGVNRLLHYGLVGRFAGVSPTPLFDADYYLNSNPDVARAGLDALAHFQRWGWREGRSPFPGIDLRTLMASHPELRVSRANPLALLARGELTRPPPPSAPAAARAGGHPVALRAPACARRRRRRWG